MANDDVLDNKSRMYEALYFEAKRAFKAKDYKLSRRLAYNLYVNADLPRILRAGCCLLLSTSSEGDYLRFGVEAVEEYQWIQDNYPSRKSPGRLIVAQNALIITRKRHDERALAEIQAGSEEEDKEDEGLEEEGDVAAQP